MTYYLATKNMKKLAELRRILGPAGVDVICEKDLESPLDEVEETGLTFEENALLKAEAACLALNIPAVADDSGLVVDALDGRPGIYSARFAGEECDDEKNIDLLLSLMKDIPEENRTARFVSAVACVYPDGRKFTVRGSVEGRIAFSRHGSGGFGYDPVFISELGSFGEISAEEKDSISHRGRALEMLRQRLVSEKILIFGGTFDPPHIAHADMLKAAAEKIKPEQILIIPTADPPHKERKGISSAEDRLAMCRLAFEGFKNAEISDMEIARGGKSYTVETIRELKRKYPEKELLLLCGGDMFATLKNWVEAEEIIAGVVAVGVRREGYEEDFTVSARRLWNAGAKIEIIEDAVPEISSTAIREAIKNGEDIDWAVCESISKYIKDHRLYIEE